MDVFPRFQREEGGEKDGAMERLLLAGEVEVLFSWVVLSF